MHKRTVASTTLLALALSATAQAVHLDPGGRGQVLIYPYYTVNKQQQTLVSVTNSSTVAQVVKLRFREGHNGRSVRDLNIWLPPYDVWTGTVFALRDAGIDSDGAAIMTTDSSCTSPKFTGTDGMVNGSPYLAFDSASYLSPDDGGPYSIERTREGWLEVIAMADVSGSLRAAVSYSITGTVPAACHAVENLMASTQEMQAPTGALSGSAGIINVGQGTYFHTRAEGLGGFTKQVLFTGANHSAPTLADVNDSADPASIHVVAHRFTGAGDVVDFTFPGIDPRSRRIDAVSAVLMADQVHNDYQVSAALAAASDWVVTFPTKPFYTDPALVAAGTVTAIPPFPTLYDAADKAPIIYHFNQHDRVGKSWFPGYCHTCFGVPVPMPRLSMGHAVSVLDFRDPALGESAVLGSRLNESIRPHFDAGWMALQLNHFHQPHAMLASAEGNVLRGLPAIGFWASNVVNNHVSNGVLANYSAAERHSGTMSCSNGMAVCD